MKNLSFLIISLLFPLALFAQPSEVKKAAKSVFTLTTFCADGSVLNSSHGVFLGAQGEAISLFSPFYGAASAVVVDASGKKFDVDAIIGANDMYDLCRFRIKGKTTPLAAATAAAEGSAWVLGYGTKKPEIKPLPITSVETFMERYSYYIFDGEISDQIAGCPIVNDRGEVLGLATRPSNSYTIHASDAQFALSFESDALGTRSTVLQRTTIRPALPAELDQARLALIMLDANSDSRMVEQTVEEFNTLFPGQTDGYSTRARIAYAKGEFDLVDAAMEEAAKKATQKDEALAEHAKFVYSKCVFLPDSLGSSWTLDRALDLITQAYAVNPLPAHLHQQAQIEYARGNFSEALELFTRTSEEMPTSEVFYEMAQSNAMLENDDQTILDCLDRSVEACPQPLGQISAPYILARGMHLEDMGELRRAMADYNLYDTLYYFNASDDFYYRRYQCEQKLRMFQQALNDIAHAAYLQPREIVYLAEMAALQLRLGQLENTLRTCELALSVEEELPDIYIIRGAALGQQGRKEEALQALNRAKELGDARADTYIEKYCQ